MQPRKVYGINVHMQSKNVTTYTVRIYTHNSGAFLKTPTETKPYTLATNIS